jgi:hypothetical protein
MKLQCSKLDILAIIVLVINIACITELIIINGTRHDNTVIIDYRASQSVSEPYND